MNNVVPIRCHGRPAPVQPSPYELFGLARRAMCQAYLAWLRTRPPAEDVETEIAGTMAALQQMASMEASNAR